MVVRVIAFCRNIKHYHVRLRFLCVMGRIFGWRSRGAHTIEGGDLQTCATALTILANQKQEYRLSG